jgi:NAD+--asparagine ADP-ribosyltransferase
MSARIYTCDSSKKSDLQKMMSYDPYLDASLIPSIPKEWDDPKYLKQHPEVEQEATTRKKQVEEAITKLKNDEMANVIFARQDYKIKDGISLDLDRNKLYLYISASDEFLEKADKKLKASGLGIERVDSELEKKIITEIEEEQAKGESGFGYIFGG